MDPQVAVALVVELDGGSVAFHRVVGALQRKRVGFTSLIFTGHRAIIHLAPDRRSIELLVALVERDPVVISVDVQYLRHEAITDVLGQVLTLGISGEGRGGGSDDA